MRYPLRVSTVGQRYGVVHIATWFMGRVSTGCGLVLKAVRWDVGPETTCQSCLARLKREGQ